KIVATVPPGQAVALRTQGRRLQRLALARGVGHAPVLATANDDGTAAALFLPLAGSGNNKASRRAILTLRNDLFPRTIGTIPGCRCSSSSCFSGSRRCRFGIFPPFGGLTV